MKLYVVLLLLFVQKCRLLKPKPTLPIDERIQYLKNEIKRTIIQRQDYEGVKAIEEYVQDDGVEYEERRVITPVLESDERRTDGKFGLKKPKTEATTEDGIAIEETTLSPMVLKKVARAGNIPDEKLEIFYRRAMDPETRNKPMKWIHCQDMFRPYLTCDKSELNQIANVTFGNHDVMRLISLLRLNTSNYSNDDIYAVMLQLSNVKIKFFQWDVIALKGLLNVLILEHSRLHDKKIDFSNTKSALKHIFSSWGMDFGDTTNLLKAAKIFRPPCLPALADKFASTKSVKAKNVSKDKKMLALGSGCPPGKPCLFSNK